MAVQAHRTSATVAPARRPDLRLVHVRRRRVHLDLLSYAVGNALFWALWAALFVSADPWYWWPIVPLAGWTLVLTAHLRQVYGGREP